MPLSHDLCFDHTLHMTEDLKKEKVTNWFCADPKKQSFAIHFRLYIVWPIVFLWPHMDGVRDKACGHVTQLSAILAAQPRGKRWRLENKNRTHQSPPPPLMTVEASLIDFFMVCKKA